MGDADNAPLKAEGTEAEGIAEGASNDQYTPPKRIIIVGAGVFGLSTALALTNTPRFADTEIIVIDRAFKRDEDLFTARDAASIDSSRIVRNDYADPVYSAMAEVAGTLWRRMGPGLLGEGAYFESGFVLTAGRDGNAAETKAETGTGTGAKADGTGTETGTETGDAASGEKKKKKTPMEYVVESFANAQDMEAPTAPREGGQPGTTASESQEPTVVELGTPGELREATGAAGHVGDWGYLNKRSGWTDAEGGMRWLYKLVKATNRVHFISATISRLLYSEDEVTGVVFEKNENKTEMGADLVVVAAGAWSGRLVDLRGVCSATGQAIAYVKITDEEQEMLKDKPILLNLSTGLFVLPPRNNMLKVARHAYGYYNPVQVPVWQVLPRKPRWPDNDGNFTDAEKNTTITVSLPRTKADDPRLKVPLEAHSELREALRSYTCLPHLAKRPFCSTRLCWYNDTATGDFLMDYHPNFKNLFLATGGCGHGYKFLPVIGGMVVGLIMRELDARLRDKFAWKEGETCKLREDFEVVLTEDGSRSGGRGVILQEELDRDKRSKKARRNARKETKKNKQAADILHVHA